MNGWNSLSIIGNVVRDAELKTVDFEGTPTPRCRFSVAVNKTNAKGDDVATYFDVVLWRDKAVRTAPWILKGRQVFVNGSVDLNQYISNGVIRSSLQVGGDVKVVLLGKKPEIDMKAIEELANIEPAFG